MKYSLIIAALLATTSFTEGNMIRQVFTDKRKIATPDASGKFSQINCGSECCPCTSCCSCPCGGDTKADAATEAANRAIEAAEDMKAKAESE